MLLILLMPNVKRREESKLTLYSHKYIKEQANQLLKKFNILEPPIDIYKIADELNIEIIEMTMPNWFFGVLMEVKNDFYIILNKMMPESRKIFTLAHEIAHHQIHNDKIAYMKNTKRPYFHTEADVFAAELCMPSELVRKEARNWFNDHKYLAKLFGVSEVAMVRKLEELKLIPEGRHNWEYSGSNF